VLVHCLIPVLFIDPKTVQQLASSLISEQPRSIAESSLLTHILFLNSPADPLMQYMIKWREFIGSRSSISDAYLKGSKMITGVSLFLASLLTLYFLLGEPILGFWLYQRFLKEVAVNPVARSKFYVLWSGLEWLWIIVIGVIVLLGSVPLPALGLQVPENWGLTLGLSAYCVGVIVISTVLTARQIKKNVRGGLVQSLLDLREMLPHTPFESLLWLMLSVTAGICEEIAFRGFLPWSILQIVQFFGGQGPFWWGLVISTVIFGFAHVYQGWKGVLQTGLIGAIMAAIYLWTKSLILPIILHTLIDSRDVFLAPGVLSLAQTMERVEEKPT
jgi:membrane protease YdiL (CAAX protease family)